MRNKWITCIPRIAAVHYKLIRIVHTLTRSSLCGHVGGVCILRKPHKTLYQVVAKVLHSSCKIDKKRNDPYFTLTSYISYRPLIHILYKFVIAILFG